MRILIAKLLGAYSDADFLAVLEGATGAEIVDLAEGEKWTHLSMRKIKLLKSFKEQNNLPDHFFVFNGCPGGSSATMPGGNMEKRDVMKDLLSFEGMMEEMKTHGETAKFNDIMHSVDVTADVTRDCGIDLERVMSDTSIFGDKTPGQPPLPFASLNQRLLERLTSMFRDPNLK